MITWLFRGLRSCRDFACKVTVRERGTHLDQADKVATIMTCTVAFGHGRCAFASASFVFRLGVAATWLLTVWFAVDVGHGFFLDWWTLLSSTRPSSARLRRSGVDSESSRCYYDSMHFGTWSLCHRHPRSPSASWLHVGQPGVCERDSMSQLAYIVPRNCRRYSGCQGAAAVDIIVARHPARRPLGVRHARMLHLQGQLRRPCEQAVSGGVCIHPDGATRGLVAQGLTCRT